MKKIGEFKVSKTVLCLGAEMMSSFCLLKDGSIFISDNFGSTSDLSNFEELVNFIEEEIEGLHIDVIVIDKHPGYNISNYGRELALRLGCSLVEVQHHLAHAYSVAGEHGINDFSAIVCDGLGYGDDTKIWGGEVFRDNTRVGHLEYQKQLGGDSATLYPYKMLFSILSKIEKTSFVKMDEAEKKVLMNQLNQNFNCPLTSSTGRVLDAASVLLGFCEKREYEGSPAIALDKNATEPYSLEPVIENGVLRTTPLFSYLIENIEKDKGRLAATVLTYISEGLYRLCSPGPIVFSGGCAKSRVMRSYLLSKDVLMNKEVDCGDLGVSYGQMVYYLNKS